MSGVKLGIEEINLLEKIKSILENNILLEDELSLKEKEKDLLKLKNENLLKKIEELENKLELLTKENEELKNNLSKQKVEVFVEEDISIKKEEKKEVLYSKKWSDYENFKKNEKDLENYIKKFTINDYKEMYAVGKNKKILKGIDERNLSDVLTRLKLNIQLTNTNIENIENIYSKIMNNIYKEKLKDKELRQVLDYELYSKNKNKLKDFILTFSLDDFKKIYSIGKEKEIFTEVEERQLLTVITWLKWNTPLKNLNIEKITNLYTKFMEINYGNKDKKEEVINIQEYTAEDWYKLYEISKEENHISEWFKGYLLTLGRDVENGLVINNLQHQNLKKYQNELNRLVKKMNLKKEEDSIKEEQNTISENYVESEKNLNMKTFWNVLSEGLKSGVVEMEDLKQIDYDKDKDAYDVYEAIEILESRGVRIKY